MRAGEGGKEDRDTYKCHAVLKVSPPQPCDYQHSIHAVGLEQLREGGEGRRWGKEGKGTIVATQGKAVDKDGRADGCPTGWVKQPSALPSSCLPSWPHPLLGSYSVVQILYA